MSPGRGCSFNADWQFVWDRMPTVGALGEFGPTMFSFYDKIREFLLLRKISGFSSADKALALAESTAC